MQSFQLFQLILDAGVRYAMLGFFYDATGGERFHVTWKPPVRCHYPHPHTNRTPNKSSQRTTAQRTRSCLLMPFALQEQASTQVITIFIIKARTRVAHFYDVAFNITCEI